MILILGNTDDSLIYLKTMLRYSEEKNINSQLIASVGKIYGQDVALATTGYSSYRSLLVASVLIQKFSPYLVIFVGDGMKLTKGLQPGDIFLGSDIKITDVDQMNRIHGLHMYEVPGFPIDYHSSDSLINMFNDSCAQVDIINSRIGTVMSGNTSSTKSQALNFNIADEYEIRHEEMIYDGEAGGISLACSFFNIPLYAIFSVSYEVDADESLLSRTRTILQDSIDIGKIIVSSIVAVSSDENKFIRDDEYAPDKRIKF